MNARKKKKETKLMNNEQRIINKEQGESESEMDKVKKKVNEFKN